MQKEVMIKRTLSNTTRTHSALEQGREELNLNKEEGRADIPPYRRLSLSGVYNNRARPQTS